MRVPPLEIGPSGSAEVIEELAGRVRATGIGSRALSLAGAAFA